MRKQNGSAEEFEIRWFRENTTGGVEELGRGSPEVVTSNGTRMRSRYHDRDLLNQQYSPSLLGKYWCQVINTTSDPDQPLMRSNVFTLLAPGDYNGTTCPTVQTLANTTCADLPAVQLTTSTYSPTTIRPTDTTTMRPTDTSLPTNTLIIIPLYGLAVIVLVVLTIIACVFVTSSVLVYKKCSHKNLKGKK